MGDGIDIPPSKKRAAGRELSRDNPGLDDENDAPEEGSGTFQRASEEVLANRRIVKVRRQQTTAASSTPSANPFAAIRLVPSAPNKATSEAQTGEEGDEVDQKVETNIPLETGNGLDDKIVENNIASEKESEQNDKKLENKTEDVPIDALDKNKVEVEVDATANEEPSEEGAEPNQADEKGADGGGEETEGAKSTDNLENDVKKDGGSSDTSAVPLSSFQQLSSSRNAFTGLAGTGFGTSGFSFGSGPKDGSSSVPAFGFGSNTDQPSIPSFSFSTSNNGSTPLFSSIVGTKGVGSGLQSMQEVPVETGEENEEAVFNADSVLFEYVDGGWKERGKGEVKVNVSTPGNGKARLVMRAKGNYRLILNASLYPDMKLTNMEKKGITFACMNSATEGKKGLSTFALKFKDVSIVEAFSKAVTAHKGEAVSALKTPENSPKASED